MGKITKGRTFSNPPTAPEIKAAREVVTEVACPWADLDKDPTPEVMKKAWEGEGWHGPEIYFGILIGLQIAKARREKEKT